MPKKEQQCMESHKKPSKVLTGDKRATLKWSVVVIQKMGLMSGSWKPKSGYRGQRNEDGWKGMREIKKRNEIQIDDERLANFPFFLFFFLRYSNWNSITLLTLRHLFIVNFVDISWIQMNCLLRLASIFHLKIK